MRSWHLVSYEHLKTIYYLLLLPIGRQADIAPRLFLETSVILRGVSRGTSQDDHSSRVDFGLWQLFVIIAISYTEVINKTRRIPIAAHSLRSLARYEIDLEKPEEKCWPLTRGSAGSK